MDIVRWSIGRPVGVAVGVLLVVMFGLIALGEIPIQLTPTVDRPIITVNTRWPGRSPQEVVDEITREQEKVLKNVANLKSMRSTTREGEASITLEFYVGSDIARALQEVSDSLRQVPAYPDEVDEPTIEAAEGAAENAIAWMIVDVRPEARGKHTGWDITTLFDALDKEVRPYLERIDGVAEVNIYGGREREVRVLVDPAALALRSLSAQDVIDALRAENRNVSAGTIAEGKRDYRVRVLGQFASAQEVMDTVVAYRQGKPVYVRDVGRVEIGHQKVRGFVRSMGTQCIAINAIRQSNANVVKVMAELRARLEEVRREILPRLDPVVGPDLRLRQVYDETTYIDSAIALVLDNLWLGGLIAAGVLLLFLRTLTATAIISVAIPISVIGTFLVMAAFGRTLNVISLAGLAFATGMVVDNAVVVLENIYRRLQMGDAPREASYRGGREVWGAVLASTLTTIAVFIPVLTIREEVGQLFRDISLAIAVSVALSLLVSITVIPSACALFVRPGMIEGSGGRWSRAWHGLFGIAPLFGRVADGLGISLRWMMSGWRGWTVRPGVIAALTAASLAAAVVLRPPMDYLPAGNRNLVFGGLLIPPGYSIEQNVAIAERIEAQLKPYVEARLDRPETVAALPPIPRFGPPGPDGKPLMFAPVPVEQFFIGSFGGGMFIGATSQDPQRVIPVGNLLTTAMNSIPDAFGGAQQSSIFGRGVGGGNSVNLEISGPRIERVLAAARMMFDLCARQYGYGKVRPDPTNFNLLQQEVRVRLSDRGRELGLRTRDIGTAVRGLFDGAFVDDFRLGADTVDMVVLPAEGRMRYKEQLAGIPVATPDGSVVPLDSVVEITSELAPQDIQRIEELPSVTVRITPPEGMPVQQLMEEVREAVIAPAQAAGVLDSTMRVRLEGTAAKLDEVQQALFGPPGSGGSMSAGQRVGVGVSLALSAAGLLVGLRALWRAARSGRSEFAWGGVGIVLITLVAAGVLAGMVTNPGLLTARFIWALAVTYLLMCALFESFVYPLVIMFSVPVAIVGGFVGLALLHRVTLLDPTRSPQLFDTLTMLGFFILIGTVVNNAILLVEQALNFMDPSRFGSDEAPLAAFDAISASVRSRLRPIFMTTLTTLGGMLPLVIAPGAGSEMYRGLGAVVLGGLLCSTVFTLVLVPLAFSLVIQMKLGVSALSSRGASAGVASPDRRAVSRQPRGSGGEREPGAVAATTG